MVPPGAREEAPFCWLWRLKMFGKFLGQAVVVFFVRWVGKERIPHRRRFPAQLASPSCLFWRSLGFFFLQARLRLGDRPRWTWREAKTAGRRPLSSQEAVDDVFILESPSPPPPTSLSHLIPELVGGDREREEERSGTSLQAGKKQWPSSGKIVYLGSPRRSRILIFEVEKKIFFFLIKALK